MRKIDREALERAYKLVDDLRDIRRQAQDSIGELRTLDPRISEKLTEALPLLNGALAKLAGI